jgi:hypothetical protein
VSDWLLELPDVPPLLPQVLAPARIGGLRDQTAHLIAAPVEDLDDRDLEALQSDWQRVADAADLAIDGTRMTRKPAILLALTAVALLVEAVNSGALIVLVRWTIESAGLLSQLISYVAQSPIGATVAFLGGLLTILGLARGQPPS